MSNTHTKDRDNPDELYSEGVEYLHRGSWGKAVAAFRQLISIDPEYEDVWQRLDEAKKKARKFEDLEDLYAASKVHLVREHWEAAIVYLKRIVDSGERHRDAAALLEEARKQLNLRALYEEATACLREGKWEKAIEVLEEIDRIDGANEDCQAKLDYARKQHRLQDLYRQVLGHFREERWPQAITDLNAIIGEAPDYLDAADRLSEAEKQQGLAALYSAGVGFLETGTYGEAIEAFGKIIQRVEVYKDVADRLARAHRLQELDRRFKQGADYAHHRQWEQAVREFERVRALAPNYRNFRARLKEARRQLRIEQLRERAEGSFRDENWREAVKTYTELHRLDARDASAATKLEAAKRQLELDKLYHRGMKHFRKGRYRKAEAALRKVTSLDPDYRDAAAQLKAVREHPPAGHPIVELLRDPFLQGIGVLLAIIVAVAPFMKNIARRFDLVELVRRTPTPKPPTLCNGGFEDDFACWQHGGKLDQSIECDRSGCYAVLGKLNYTCEGGVPVGEAWIKQSFQVPNTISPTLSLRYQVFSYDLDTYDFFQLSIDGNPVFQDGNTEWHRSSCEAEVWDSGQRSWELDLSPHIGKTIELSLRNVNGEHEWYNTWTYVDDVEVR